MVSQAQQRVLDTSRTLFATQGTCVSMRDIARELGIRAPSIYSHFPAKEALIERCIEEYTSAIALWSQGQWDDPFTAALEYEKIVKAYPESALIAHSDMQIQKLPVVIGIEGAIHATFVRSGVPLALVQPLAAFVRAPYMNRRVPLTEDDEHLLFRALDELCIAIRQIAKPVPA